MQSRDRARNQRDITRQAKALLDLLRAWLTLLLKTGVRGRNRRARTPRPWHLRIGRKDQPVTLTRADVERLLQRHRDLKDNEALAATAALFRLPESDFFADPAQIERLLRHFLEEDPPWLHLGRTLSGGDLGSALGEEILWREQETRSVEEATLFVPDESWRDKPLASMTLRPAHTLQEAWQARLLDQVLPPELLLDRIARGEVLIPIRQRMQQRLEFRPEQRRIEIVTRKPVPVPVETEGGGGVGGQLLYFLLDGSASMRGKSGILALAVIMATLRANMGRASTRYLFRRYAQEDELWPREIEPPWQAQTVAEKDRLLDTILAVNFNGSATHVNHALRVAMTDIENLRREERLEASILLVTDGRAEILESTALHLRSARIKLHTVMVTPEKNPELEAISESFTALDIRPELRLLDSSAATSPPVEQPRRVFHI